MPNGNEEQKRPIEVVSDEDWKTRVKAEDAKRDAESKGQPGDGPDSLPPPSFGSLIQILSTQAIMALGMIPGPDGNPTQHLPLARHFIDLLSVLEKKTSGNLDAEEAKFLEGTLHELRMAYLEISKNGGANIRPE